MRRSTFSRAVSVACAIMVVACAQTVDDIERSGPFPCAQDSSCPGGFECRHRLCQRPLSCASTDGSQDMRDCGGDACVDVSSDVSHCGACGTVCDTGQGCCAGQCITVSSDASNCGACGKRCGGDLSCADGKCGCPTGKTACSTSCVDLQVDGNNCGKCGHACGQNTLCSRGTCRCEGGYPNVCGNDCFDLTSDPNHCGACSNACESGDDCIASGDAGAPTCTCVSPHVECPGPNGGRGTCADFTSDQHHCGNCQTDCAAQKPTGLGLLGCRDSKCCFTAGTTAMCGVAPVCGCAPGSNCVYQPAAGVTGFACTATGSTQIGDLCTTVNQCMQDAVCVGDSTTSSTSHCRAYCSAAKPCTSGSCTQVVVTDANGVMTNIPGYTVCAP